MSDELYLDYCGRALCVRERVCMSDESSSTLNTPPPSPIITTSTQHKTLAAGTSIPTLI